MRSFIVTLLCAIAAPTFASESARVLSSAGVWSEGPVTIAGGSVTGGANAIPLDQLLVIEFPDAQLPTRAGESVTLVSGDHLIGVIDQAQAGVLRFASESLGALDIPTADVRGLWFGTHDLIEPSAPADFEGVELINGDRIGGTLEWINDEKVGIKNERSIRSPARDRVGRVVRKAAPSSAERPPHQVRLANGDLLTGTIASLTGEKLILQAGKQTRTLAVGQLCAIWQENKDLVALSGMRAADIRQTPQFDEDFPPTFDCERRGGFLRIAGRRYERGIGCHSRCELNYDLDGSFAALVCELGIDARTADRGEAIVTASVDGKAVYDSGALRCGEQPKLAVIPLNGGKRLQLSVGGGANGSSLGATVDLGWPTLVRAAR